MPPEGKILEEALHKFHDATGLNLKRTKNEFQAKARHRVGVRLLLQTPHINCRFDAEVKTRLTPATLGAAVHQLGKNTGGKLLVADYVNPHMAERLKEMNIPFLDAVGNIYLHKPPLFIYIKGNKHAEKFDQRPPTLAFQPGGLKILFLFLCVPELVNAPYRTVADKAGVALGTVGLVLKDLKKMGYLVTMKKGRRLAQKKKIIERWTEAYPERIRHNLLVGRFRAKDENWWQHANIGQNQAYWGGEVAAAKLTHYLKPGAQTVYVRNELTKLIIRNELIQDPQGNVEILKTFWNFKDKRPNQELVPPLLVYTDLLLTGEPRNIETARLIYDQHLTRLIGED